MTIAWTIGAALIGLIVGWILREWVLQKSPPSSEAVNAAQDRARLLFTLRRELANFMVRHDPDRFLRLYKNARAECGKINDADAKTQNSELAKICNEYPYYTDLDLVAVRDHVLYEDGLSWNSVEDIEAHYLVLVRFHALQCATNRDWRMSGDATSEVDLEHLKKYVQRVKDTKFKRRIIAAVETYHSRRDLYETEANSRTVFENDVIEVLGVSHFAENRHGIHFKDTDEYGLYGSFYDDDRDKYYYTYFRSDPTFETETGLDIITDFDGTND
jgi:hypothetical protein